MASCFAGWSSDWCSCGPCKSTSHSPSVARRREGALEDELVLLARFQPVLVEKTFQRRAQFRHVEHRLDRAALRPGAKKRAVGALAERETDGAKHDGFARAGLAGNDVAAGLKLQRQVGDKREVFNPQRGEHGNLLAGNLRAVVTLAKKKSSNERPGRNSKLQTPNSNKPSTSELQGRCWCFPEHVEA